VRMGEDFDCTEICGGGGNFDGEAPIVMFTLVVVSGFEMCFCAQRLTDCFVMK